MGVLSTGIKSKEDFEQKRKNKEQNRRKVKEERKNRLKEKKGAEQAKTLDKDQFIQKQKEKKAAE